MYKPPSNAGDLIPQFPISNLSYCEANITFKAINTGLCGIWNGNDADDQTARRGAQEEDLAKFGYSWKIEENGKR